MRPLTGVEPFRYYCHPLAASAERSLVAIVAYWRHPRKAEDWFRLQQSTIKILEKSLSTLNAVLVIDDCCMI